MSRGRPVTDYGRHGYFHGLSDGISDMSAMIIFSKRRSGDVLKFFGHELSYDDMIARVYYQGLLDGIDITKNSKPPVEEVYYGC